MSDYSRLGFADDGMVWADAALDLLLDAAFRTKGEEQPHARYDEVRAFADKQAGAVPLVH